MNSKKHANSLCKANLSHKIVAKLRNYAQIKATILVKKRLLLQFHVSWVFCIPLKRVLNVFCNDIRVFERKGLLDWEKKLEISAKCFAMANVFSLLEAVIYMKTIYTQHWFIHCFLHWEILYFHFVAPIWPGWKTEFLKLLKVIKQSFHH